MIHDLQSPEPSPEPQAVPAPVRFAFTGSGGEYFRIWIVNLALTFITFGIYSPWAKVRRLQYFYRNTLLDGSGFDYHGSPIAILKGRLIAFGLIAAYKFALTVSVLAAVILAVAIAGIMPWLLVRSLAFRMRYSSWRGLRFRFNGSVPGGYRVFLLWPLAAALSLGLLAPLAHRALKAYQHGNAAFGTQPFAFSGRVSEFYDVWVRAALLAAVLPIGLFALGFASQVLEATGTAPVTGVGDIVMVIAVVVGGYVLLMMAMPYFLVRSQNLVWNHTTLGVHRFESRLKFDKVLWLMVSNFFLTVLTIGLFRPFAVVRMARYRAQCMTLVPGESLDGFVAQQSGEVAAIGEEVAEFFDIDIAL